MLTLMILLLILGGLGRRRWYWHRPMGYWGMWGMPFMWRMGPRPPMGGFGMWGMGPRPPMGGFGRRF